MTGKRERSVIAKSGGLDDLTSWEVGRIRESDSTYDEPEVQVIRSQLLQRRLQISSDVFRPVRVVPELETKPLNDETRSERSVRADIVSRFRNTGTYLGDEEDVFPLDARVLDPLTDFILVAVDQSGVDVSKRF